MKVLFFALLATLHFFLADAAPFQNLDFEMVNTNSSTLFEDTHKWPHSIGSGPIKDLLPGWEVFNNGAQVVGIGFNDGGAYLEDGSPTYVTIFESSYLLPYGTPIPQNDKYFLEFNYTDYPIVYTLIQLGDVPTNAVAYSIAGSPLLRYLPPQDVQVRLNDVLVGGTTGDVSAFAGRNMELKITLPYGPVAGGPFRGAAILGSFQFISAPRIESSSLAATTNSFTLSWTNDAFFSYQVEFTTSFFPAKWQPLGAPVSSTNGNFTFTDNASKTNKFGSQRFYRLRTISP